MQICRWVCAVNVLVAVAASACGSGPEPSKQAQVASAAAALTAGSKAPTRSIAVVLDASNNMAQHCYEDWNTAKFVNGSPYAPDGTLFAGMTQTLCDAVPRWQLQRDGLIHAIRTSVPIDGSMALSVVFDAVQQNAESYDGPRVVVPYTVVRSDADRNAVIQLLSQASPLSDVPTTDYTYGWKGSTCKGSYDSSNDRCYSPASHAWATHIAYEQLTQCGGSAGTTVDAGAGGCARPKKTEICLAGDALHTSLPTAFWDRGQHCLTGVNGGTPVCETNWPSNVPEEAKNRIPFESIAAVDRFTVVQHDVGLSAAMFAASKGALTATPNPLSETEYGEPAWGAAISLDTTDETVGAAGEVDVSFSVVSESGDLARTLNQIAVPYTATQTAEQVAQAVEQAIASVLAADAGRLPIRLGRAGTHVLFDWNPSFDFDQNSITIASEGWVSAAAEPDTAFFPRVAVTGAHPGITVSVTGGSLGAYERVVQHQQVELAQGYGSLLGGKGSIVFASGFLPSTVAHDDTRRASDFGDAIVHCFDNCTPPDVINDQAPAPAETEPPPAEAPIDGSSGDANGSGAAVDGTQAAPTTSSSGAEAQVCAPTRLVAMEVNQVIQTWRNDIPIVAGKQTAVRVFVDSLDARTVKLTLQGYAYQDASGQACEPGASGCVRSVLGNAPSAVQVKVPKDAIASRAIVNATGLGPSGLFPLPAEWVANTGWLELKVGLAGKDKLLCRERADTTAANDCTLRVRVTTHQRPSTLIDPMVPPTNPGNELHLSQLALEWDPTDVTFHRLAVNDEDLALSAQAIGRMLPNRDFTKDENLFTLPVNVVDYLLKYQLDVRPGPTSGVKYMIPSTAWYEANCPACGGAGTEAENALLHGPDGKDDRVFNQIQAFRNGVLLRLVQTLKFRYSPKEPPGTRRVYQGLFHLPTVQTFSGVSNNDSGAFVEDAGLRFDHVDDAGAHEFIHAVGREHTNYCIFNPAKQNTPNYLEQFPTCDEPYPYELQDPSASTTVLAPSIYPEGTTYPPSEYRPLIGPLTGDAWSEVWGLELGGRYVRGSSVPFQRDASGGLAQLPVQVIAPKTGFDLMSYCFAGGVRWMSRFQYERLFGLVRNGDGDLVGDDIPLFTDSPAPDISLPPERMAKWCAGTESMNGSDGRTSNSLDCVDLASGERCAAADLVLSAAIDLDTQDVDWSPLFPVATNAVPITGVAIGTPVIVTARDANGTDLFRVTTAFSEPEEQSSDGTLIDSRRWFVTRVPSAGVRAIAVTVGGVEFAQLRASSSKPTLAITHPVANDTLVNGEYNVQWTGSDADGDELSYDVAYSVDGGASYVPLSAETPKSQFQFNLADVAGSDNARIRVTASDGFNTTVAEVGGLHVARKPPRPLILSFRDGAEFSAAETILFNAVPLDTEDGVSPNAGITWASDRDGLLGTGELYRSALDLSEGTHTITVTAVDRDGLVGTATRVIHIRRFETDRFTQSRLLLQCTHDADFAVRSPGIYHLQVRNAGATATTGPLTITDTLPDQLDYSSSSGAGWTCTANGHAVSCVYAGPALAPGDSAPELSLTVIPRDPGASTSSTYSVTNVADASAAGAIEDPGSSHAEDPTTVVVPQAPVIHTTTDASKTTFAAEPVNYTIDVGNTGQGPAYDLTVNLSISSGAQISGLIGPSWNCTHTATTGQCIAASNPVAAGAQLPSITVTVLPDAQAQQSINLQYNVSSHGAASGSGGSGGSTSSQGAITASVQQHAPPGADLSVAVQEPCDDSQMWQYCLPQHNVYADQAHLTGRTVVRGDSARVRGGTWSHKIVVKNVGAAPVDDVTVTDTLPPGAIWLHAARTTRFGIPQPIFVGDWDCEAAGQVITCDGPALAVGEVGILTIDYMIAPAATPSLVNSVTVSTPGETNLTNNTDTHTTYLYSPVHPCLLVDDVSGQCRDQSDGLTPASLATTITATDPLTVGQPGQATFTVRNSGTSSIPKNTITLGALGEPSLVLVTAYSGTGWTCTLNWGKASCTYSEAGNLGLAPNQTLPPLTVNFTVGPYQDAIMLIPAEVAATGVTAFRSLISVKSQLAADLQGPGGGTLAFTACPPGTDCKQYFGEYPTNFIQGQHQIRYLDLDSLTSIPATSGSFAAGAPFSYDEPAWSRDGRLLAYNYHRGGCTPSFTDRDCASGISFSYLDAGYSASFDSDISTGETWSTRSLGSARFGSWSPDASAFVFSDASFSGCTDSGAIAAHPDPQDGTNVCYVLRLARRATRSSLNHGSAPFYSDVVIDSQGDVFPAWSPLGTTIAYTAGATPKIWLVDVTPSGNSPTNQRRLTTAAATVKEERPAWSRDGSKLAFSSGGNIHISAANGSNELVFTTGGSDTAPTWSPDGTQIAFERGADDPGIFVAAVSGGAPQLVARGRTPAWKPVVSAPSAPAGVQPPHVVADTISTSFALPGTVNVLSNDSDPANSALSVAGYTQGARGDVSCQPSGSCTYTPKPNFVGQDGFTYNVVNALGATATGSVRIDVSGASAKIDISTPKPNSAVNPPGSVTLTGTATLNYFDPAINVVYAVDEGNGLGNRIKVASSTLPSSGLPSEWMQRPNNYSGLCNALIGASSGNLVNCYLTGLNRSLAAAPSVQASAFLFADDYMGVKVSAGYWAMESRLHHPRDYWSDVFGLDVDPTTGNQIWTGPTTDKNGNGRPDIEDALASLNLPQSGTLSCNYGSDPPLYDVGGAAFGPLLGDPKPTNDPAFYGPGINCRFGSVADQTYDWVIDRINTNLAARPATQRNVVYLFSPGRAGFAEGEDTPLQRAVRAGTIIHTFAPKAPTQADPVDVIWLVNSVSSSSTERSNIAARMSDFATQLMASGLDYRVVLISDTDWFASTALPHNFQATTADASTELSNRIGTISPYLRPAATLHLVGVNLTTTPDSKLFGKSFFGHAISRLGPVWCPGSTADTTGFSWADDNRGTKNLTCGSNWSGLVDALKLPNYGRFPEARVLYGSSGSRSIGSCAPGNALERLARLTGGTCTELDWNTQDISAKLPAAVRVGIAGAQTPAGIEGIDRIELTRPGGTPVLASYDSSGNWSGQVIGVGPGPNVLTATLYTKYGHSTSANVTVIGQAGYNHAPVVQDESITPTPGQISHLELLLNDTDPDGDLLSVASFTQPAAGSVSCNPSGVCDYAAPSSLSTADSFTYLVQDGRGGQATGTVHIVFDAAPFAPSYALRVRQGDSIGVNVLRDANDPEGQAIGLDAWSLSTRGSVGCASDGRCDYLAPKDWFGVDSFTYTIVDTQGVKATGTVSVLVTQRGGDAALVLSHSGDFVVGMSSRYDIDVSNQGNDNLNGVLVLQQLPGIVYQSFSGSGWQCTDETQLRCTHSGVLQPGALYPRLSVFGIPTEVAIPQVTAVATLVATPDIDPRNNTAEDLTAVHQVGDDASVTLTGAGSVCTAQSDYQVSVHNGGGAPIAAGLRVDGSVPSELTVSGVDGAGWNCQVTVPGFSCALAQALGSLENPPAITVHTQRAASNFGLRSLNVTLTLASDTDASNNQASLPISVLDARADSDGDGVVDCADTCAHANAAQTDRDGDGLGDACDNCPDAPNPDQRDSNRDGAGDACQPVVDIHWVVSNGAQLQADVDVHDPDGDAVFGDLSIDGQTTPPKLTSITFTADGDCGAGSVRLKLNGHLIATPTWTNTACKCTTGIFQFLNITDPALLAAYNRGGSNVLSIEKAPGTLGLAWLSIRFNFDDSTNQSLCAYDSNGALSPCNVSNACTHSVNSGGISVSQNLPVWTPESVNYFLDYYANSAPSHAWDASYLPAGTYSLLVTGNDGKTPQVSQSKSFQHGTETAISVNPRRDLSGAISTIDSLPVCGQFSYYIGARNAGTQTISDPIQLHADFASGYQISEVQPYNWTCSQTGNKVDCTIDETMQPGDGDGLFVTVNVTAPVGALLTTSVHVTTASGDELAADDTVYGRVTVTTDSNGDDLDYDHDGLPACVDICPNNHPEVDADADNVCDIGSDNCVGVSNPTQADQDGDGMGDACDLCPTSLGGTTDMDADGVGDSCDNCASVPNPDQADSNHDHGGDACQPTVNIVSVTPNNDRLRADVALADPNGDPLHGDVIVGSGLALDALVVDFMAACSPVQVAVQLNQHEIARYTATNAACGCNLTTPHSTTLQAKDFPGVFDILGSNDVSVNVMVDDSSFTAIAWLSVTALYADGTADEHCLIDSAAQPSCSTPRNICSAGYVSSSSSGGKPLTSHASVVSTTPYVNSTLPASVSLLGATPGDYLLRVTASDGSSVPASDQKPFTLQAEVAIDFGNSGCVDTDQDTVCANVDNCPAVANADQHDADADGKGDACDSCVHDPSNDASDHDGVCDDLDNCIGVANPSQADLDRDGRGDACDACPADASNDADHDGICDNVDNCIGVPNPDQIDSDHNGQGDACDLCAHFTCLPLDQCHLAGSCDHATGACSNPVLPDGSTCNDGNVNTVQDQCRGGVCSGSDLCANVTCTALDQCHVAGTCDHATGLCSMPLKPNGSPCSDSDACTTADTCQAGTCSGGAPISCADASACTIDSCNSASGCVHTVQHLPPVFTTLPPNPVLASDCGAVNLGSAAAADTCQGQTITISNDACGTSASPCGDFGRGTKSVVWTARDTSDLTTQTSVTVTVTDTTAPKNLVAPPAITLASGSMSSLAQLDPNNARSAFDSCGSRTSQPISWRTQPALPATLPAGTSTVLWYASDDLGNENPTPVSQQVTVASAGAGASSSWTGHNFSCELNNSAKVQCWGTNGDGELGDGTYTERWAPANANISNVVQLGVGFEHACAVTSSGAVQCWGEGSCGRLGNNSYLDSATPVSVIGLSGVKQVAAGGDILAGHSCAVLNNGEVWCWGSGVNGRLGNNANLDRYTPVKVQLPNGTLATQVSAGGHHTCAVDVAGKAWCWGEGLNGQLGNGLLLDRLTPTQVSFGAGVSITQISAGGAHTCAVDTKNRVWCWGANLDGQLGNNSILNRAVPVQVSNFSNAVQVSAGDEHTCAVLANGQVWCWGEGQNGRLCLNLLGDSLVPVQVPGVSNALQVSAGDDQTCARVIDAGSKKDLCWGGDSHGQLGNGENLDSSSAVPVARMCMPTAISAGDAFTCALASGSTGASVYAWGSNSSWQLGDGTSISRRATAPVANSSTASAVSCGSAHGCEIVAGQARCWGNNGSGRLGDGTTTNRSKPVAVSATDTYSMVATGDAHSCGIVSGGAVKCWGYGANGRLGNGSTANKLVPTSVTGLPGAASWIATGDAHSCAVVANGTNREVWCWGTGAYGRLGNNATNDALAPVKVTGISNALAVSAGALHTCATTTAAGVWCWGHGGNGRLGNGATANSNVPVPVQGTNGSTLVLSSASALAAGDDFSCVTGVGTNSQLACWGNNAFGTLGDGTNTSSARAKVVPGVANASAVTAADGHACAIIAGEAYCWGSNGDANLGDGTLLSRTSPRLVAVEACQ